MTRLRVRQWGPLTVLTPAFESGDHETSKVMVPCGTPESSQSFLRIESFVPSSLRLNSSHPSLSSERMFCFELPCLIASDIRKSWSNKSSLQVLETNCSSTPSNSILSSHSGLRLLLIVRVSFVGCPGSPGSPTCTYGSDSPNRSALIRLFAFMMFTVSVPCFRIRAAASSFASSITESTEAPWADVGVGLREGPSISGICCRILLRVSCISPKRFCVRISRALRCAWVIISPEAVEPDAGAVLTRQLLSPHILAEVPADMDVESVRADVVAPTLHRRRALSTHASVSGEYLSWPCCFHSFRAPLLEWKSLRQKSQSSRRVGQNTNEG